MQDAHDRQPVMPGVKPSRPKQGNRGELMAAALAARAERGKNIFQRALSKAEDVASHAVKTIGDIRLPAVAPGARITTSNKFGGFKTQGVKGAKVKHAAEAVGEFVADFLDQAIESGMRLRFCSARLSPLIQARTAWVASRPEVMPEVRARVAIQHLLADERLVLEDDLQPEAIEDLIDEAARFLERHGQAQHLAQRFADWLSQHPAVNDLYADDDTVRAALSAAVVGSARLSEAMRRAGRRGSA